MKLLDLEDFNSLGRTGAPYELTLNPDGTQDPGPFLFSVNDQGAWLGRNMTLAPGLTRLCVVPLNYASTGYDQFWYKAADLWVRDEDIDRGHMLRRYRIITRALTKTGPRVWTRWDTAYHWPDGSDLMWDGLEIHPFITRREEHGVREVVITGSKHDQRTREWKVEL